MVSFAGRGLASLPSRRLDLLRVEQSLPANAVDRLVGFASSRGHTHIGDNEASRHTRHGSRYGLDNEASVGILDNEARCIMFRIA